MLLFDRRNPTFLRGDPPDERGLMPFLRSFVPEELQGRVHAVTIQKVAAAY